MTEKQIIELIYSDRWMMSILQTARSLDLPDWMIGAGFVRNKVWDYLHGYSESKTNNYDIDLIYFNPNDLLIETEEHYNQKLNNIIKANWSAKNQARMHEKHQRQKAYVNTLEALAEWVETPTCVAVKLENNNTISLFAPHGIEDLINLVVRPSPAFKNKLDVYFDRIKSKHWQEKWPKLTILDK